jgi:energy-converting hydrogenase A subunit M
MTFVCPELDMTYEAVYHELARHLEIDVDEAGRRFAPDDAVARVRYHRRQRQRQHVQRDLAEILEIPVEDVFAAVSEEGARILIESLRSRDVRRASGWHLTVREGAPAPAPADFVEAH